MPRPTVKQSEAIADTLNTLDHYLPPHTGPGVDTDARILLRFAESHIMEDEERDALIRFVNEWVQTMAQQIERDREWEALCDSGEIPA